MGLLKRFHGSGSDTHSVRAAEEAAYDSQTPDDAASLEQREDKEIAAHPAEVTAGAAAGVQKIEAAALVWSRPAVYATYAWIWVCFFVLALQQGMTTQLNAVAYADFVSAPQLTTAYVLATIIGGVLKLPIAKTLNLWGRAEGFLVFTGVLLLGMVVLASCNGPAGYAAGYVLYWVGYDGVYFIMDVFVADTSGLRNRAWAFAFVSTPFICTAFTAPLAATSFMDTAGWRWAYGAFVIIIFAAFVPLAVVFKFFQRKAARQGLFAHSRSGRTWWQSVTHYAREFDVVGACLLMAAFILFLLPFTLETYGLAGYSSAEFIAMVVVGILLFPSFYLWERYCAAPGARFVKWELLRQRTVLGACLLSAVLYFSFYAWDSYYYSFVVVVFDLDTSAAGYMAQIYNVGSCFWSVLFGVWVRQTRRFKHACLFFGLPLMLLGAGLMIRFRSADYGVGYLVMCQLFIAFAGGTLVIGEEMAVMAAADRDGVPVLLALVGLFTSVGGAIGSAVAAAIYDNAFPAALRAALPPALQADWQAIYQGGYLAQQAYPVGSPARVAIDYAWGRSQMLECIAATAVLALGVPAVAVWKDYNVDRRQNKGVVI